MSFLHHLYFLFNVACIICYEWSKYVLFSDATDTDAAYSLFIESLTDKLSKKNILYVKIFQACALNNNLIDDVINNKLIKFTDNAPWNAAADIDREMLYRFEEDYAVKIMNDYTPINAGMISLIFQCKKLNDNDNEIDNDNDTIILKVKRKNIEEKLNEGIAHLLFFLSMLKYLPYIHTYGLPDIIEKNITLISRQTDFIAEVRNIQRFQKVCANLNYIVIPEVDRDITMQYPSIIVMEYIQGKTIYNVDKEDYAIYAKRVMQFFFITMLMHGVMHGDLHIGNILFIKKEDKHKIGILDFGIIYEIGETRTILFDIFTQLYSSPPAEIAHKILQSGLIEPLAIIKTLDSEHYQSIIVILEEFIHETIQVNKKIQLMYLFHFLSDLNRYIAKNKLVSLTITPSADLLKIQMMFGMLHGIILTLCQNCDYIEFADTVLKETFQLDLLEY